MKVVFHVDEINKWEEAMHNIKHLLKEAPDATVVLLVNGAAITGYLNKEYYNFISHEPVEFHACQNAMRNNDVTAQQLPKNVKVVPAGVLDLVQLQDAGYAYIKP